MKPISEEWRVQAVVKLAEDPPPAYPGGPSHKKGDNVALASVTRMPEGGELTYPTPSAVALALSIAINAAKQAVRTKPTESSPIPAPGGPSSMVHDHSSLYDYFEHCFVAVTFSFQAIEAYANYKIAYKLNGQFELNRDGKSEQLSREDLERRLSTDDKLSLVLPKILSVASPKGQSLWEDFVKLKRLRDSTIHLKSHHQWTSSQNYEESPYSVFLCESPIQFPNIALKIIRYFSDGPEEPWLTGASKLMSQDLPA